MPTVSVFLYRKRLKSLLVLLWFICLGLAVQAQHQITGIVYGINKAPLYGATISDERTNSAVFTNEKGYFTIAVRTGDFLIITFVGYIGKKIRIENDTTLKISLAASVANLDDIVVTGYTTQKVKEITGSIAIVKPEELKAVPAGQVEQMLQGRVAGLTVITSGMPGAGSNIRLHGRGNFGNVTPLYIVDGVQGDINNLNPDDIESMQVLKDASAYAIYGVRSANGVIIVATKKGRTGKAALTYDFYIGYQYPLQDGYNPLTPQEEADLSWLKYKNSRFVDTSTQNPVDVLYGNGAKPLLPDYIVNFNGYQAGDPAVNPDLNNVNFRAGDIYQILEANKTGTDWFHQLFKPALSQNHSVTVSGGNVKNKYLFSLGFLDQQGTLLYTYLKRYTARLNTEFKIKNNISVGENIQVSFRDNPKIANQAPLSNNNYIGELSQSPLTPIYDIKGNWEDPFSNPIAQRNLYRNDKQADWEFFGNVFAEVDFLKHFTARTSFGGTQKNYFYNFSFRPGYNSIDGINPANNAWIGSGFNTSWTWTNILNFSKRISANSDLQLLIGTEAISHYAREVSGTSSGFFVFNPNYISVLENGATGRSSSSFANQSALYSIFGNAQFNLKDKYFIYGTWRRDGSSVFSPQTRFGWFPSIGVAYLMTNENFLKGIKWLSELKIRASWGITGFDGNTSPTNLLNLYGGGAGDAYYDINGTNTSTVRGFRNLTLGEPKTRWQQDRVSNAGMDAVLWNGKLSITTDVYNKESSGLLFPANLPATVGGAERPNVNVGNILNTGVDILLNSKGNFSKNFAWDITLTFSTYKNKIKKINGTDFFFDLATDVDATSSLVKNQVGYPTGMFFGYKVIGIFQNSDEVSRAPAQDGAMPGTFIYLDANHDGKISDLDRVFIGNPNPKFTSGVNIGVRYKNFDLSTFLYASYGNNIYSSLTRHGGPQDQLYHSWFPEVGKKSTDIPIVLAAGDFSLGTFSNTYTSFAIYNGSYLRNKSLIMGYTLPKMFLQKFGIEQLRVYGQVVNLFDITSFTGLDPELTGSNASGNDDLEIRVTTPQYLIRGPSAAFGIDNGNYPNNQRQYLIGLNVTF